ncbi:MAG: sulfatase [Pirellulaceae bacterium]
MKPQAAITLLLFSLVCGASSTATAAQPNIVFIIADDCTYWDMEVYGGQASTPNLNKLAGQGMQFSRCFQAAPMCSPTRHNIYTGLYPVKSGAYPNHTYVKEGVRSVAHYLGDAGYRVALSGKRHINPPAAFPFEYSAAKNNPDLDAINSLMSECKATDTPFCLFACSNEPHTPWNLGDPSKYDAAKIELPEFYVDTPETRAGFVKYLAEITYFDSQVGEILSLLDKHELADDTLVMVVSEQGNSLPFAKWTCYDAGLQSGMIVRWPGVVESASKSDAIVEYVDILPTFLDASNVKAPRSLDGSSFLKVLSGKRDSHKDFTYALMTTRGIINGSEHYGIRTVRSAEYRYIVNLTADVPFQNVVMKGDIWKSWLAVAESGDESAKEITSRYMIRPVEELYRISDGEYEWNNLADDPQYSDTKAALREKLESWMREQGDLGQETEMNATARLYKNRKKK